MSTTPTPPHGSPPARDDVRLGKRPRGGLRRRHLPLILVGLGAAIFAALVTIGFVQWLKRREARHPAPTSMKGSLFDDRHDARAQGRDWPNTPGEGPVEGTVREFEHAPSGSLRMALASEG